LQPIHGALPIFVITTILRSRCRECNRQGDQSGNPKRDKPPKIKSNDTAPAHRGAAAGSAARAARYVDEIFALLVFLALLLGEFSREVRHVAATQLPAFVPQEMVNFPSVSQSVVKPPQVAK